MSLIGHDAALMSRYGLWGLVAGLSSAGVGFVVWLSGVLAVRGLEVMAGPCTPQGPNRQVAVATVTNTEETFKAVYVNVQGRFAPREGQRWADRQQQVLYEQQTMPSRAVILDPHGRGAVEVAFTFQDAAQFVCTARASIGNQARFDERPNMAMVEETLRGRPTRLRGR